MAKNIRLYTDFYFETIEDVDTVILTRALSQILIYLPMVAGKGDYSYVPDESGQNRHIFANYIVPEVFGDIDNNNKSTFNCNNIKDNVLEFLPKWRNSSKDGGLAFSNGSYMVLPELPFEEGGEFSLAFWLKINETGNFDILKIALADSCY